MDDYLEKIKPIMQSVCRGLVGKKVISPEFRDLSIYLDPVYERDDGTYVLPPDYLVSVKSKSGRYWGSHRFTYSELSCLSSDALHKKFTQTILSIIN